MQFTNLLTAILLFLFTNSLFSQTEIDATFGEGGLLNAHNSSGGFRTNKPLIIGQNNKVVILNHYNNSFYTRYDTDGIIDDSFGNIINGVQYIGGGYSLPGDKTAPLAIFNKEEHIIVIDTTLEENGEKKMFVFRLSANGVAYKNFGDYQRPFRESDIFPASFSVTKVILQEDEKILFAGYVSDTLGQTDFALLRFNQDATIDDRFGNQGLVITDLGENDQFSSLVIRPNGKILAAGLSNVDDILIQYNIDGSIDKTFSFNGRIRLTGQSRYTGINQLHLLPSGKILAIGTHGGIRQRTFALYQFTPNGILDKDFGENGIIRTKFVNADNELYDVETKISLIQKDGKIVIGGTSYIGQNEQYPILSRYQQDGRVDKDFGVNGIFTLPQSRKGTAYYIQQQEKGLLFAFETQTREGVPFDYYLARIKEDFSVSIFANQPVFANQILFYPNPTQDQSILTYTLEKQDNLTIQLTDLQGRILKTYSQNQPQKAGTYQQSIDLPTYLSTNVYFLNIISPNGQVAIKVFKE